MPRAFAVAVGVAASLALACTRRWEPSPPGPPYARVRAVVERHCIGCHSEHPTVAAFPIAPQDIRLDTADEIRRYAARIRATVTVDRTMPLLNKTGMTEEERKLVGAWVEAGALR